MVSSDSTREGPDLPRVGTSTSTSDLVEDSLREAILNGRLRPGEMLVERRLAEMLGVSKTPVREALIALARTGLVRITRNKGVAIRHLTTDEARHVYEERLLLEPWAVGESAATGAGFDEAAQIMDMLRGVENGNDVVGLAILNRRFHRALYAPCPNPFVRGSLDGLQDLTTLATVNVVWTRGDTWMSERDEHAAILEACTANNGPAAAELMRRHIANALAQIGMSDHN